MRPPKDRPEFVQRKIDQDVKTRQELSRAGLKRITRQETNRIIDAAWEAIRRQRRQSDQNPPPF